MNRIFIGIKGHAVCIDKSTGDEVWRTHLKGTWGGVTNIYHDEDSVFAYVHGHLYCLNANDGNIRWENNLPGLGHSYCIISAPTSNQSIVNSAAAAAAAAAASS